MSERATKPLRARIRETVRQSILDAAEPVFAREGLHVARMEEIASGAGVSVGTLYNYFKDRATLLHEVIADRRAGMLERLESAMSELEGRPFPERLTAFVRLSLESFDAHHPLFAILLQEEMGSARVADGGGKDKATTMRELAIRAEHLMDEGFRAGLLREDEDAGTYAAFLIGMVRGLFARALRNRSSAPLAPKTEQVVRFFFEGAKRA